MDARARSIAASVSVLAAWLLVVFGLSGMLVTHPHDAQDIFGETKTAVVMVFAVLALLALTLAVGLVAINAMREMDISRWRTVWALAAPMAAVCEVVAFGAAANDAVTYGFGFALLVLALPVTLCAAFFACITDRAIGNI